MTSPGPAEAGAAARGRSVEMLSEQLPRFLRLVSAAKTHLATDPRERAALVLLYPLIRSGPLRQGALAEAVRADPSTVSRHVAALVDQGLLRREADPTDGRATQLVVTDAGLDALGELGRDRAVVLDRITAGWDDADLAAFTDLLGRFLDDLAAVLPGDAAPAPAPGELR